MGIEIDFLNVGDGSRSGDAIAFRLGDLKGSPDAYRVFVVDGGTKDSGQRLVELVRKHYGTNRVDGIVLTHPDADHASGLTVVLDEMEVGVLYMHKPWEHASTVKQILDTPMSTSRMENRLVRALSNAYELYTLANKRQVPIVEPFAGETQILGGWVTVLGPTRRYYQSLLADFREVPVTPPTLLGRAVGITEDVLARVVEAAGIETLDDGGVTSAENNSSAILHISDGVRSALLTGDAGIPALHSAADYAATVGRDLSRLDILQVPHHGSKRNVGPKVLDRIRAEFALISSAKDGAPKHPSQRVVNALIRRQAKVYRTAGSALRHGYDAPDRAGYSPATQLPFMHEFDD